MAKATILQMVEGDAVQQGMLDRSVGYAAGRVPTTKSPLVGGVYGLALLHDEENTTNTHVNITRLDLGADLGLIH